MLQDSEIAEAASGVGSLRQLSGNQAEVLILKAPARLNLFGEHVDYVGYVATSSLAIGSHEFCMTMFAAPNESGFVRGWSENTAFPAFEFSLAELDEELRQFGESGWEDYLSSRPSEPPHWKHYVIGAAAYFRFTYPQIQARGFDFLITSGIPPQGGSSSSSALVVLAGAALRILADKAFDLRVLALESSRAEWFVGTRGGALDHSTICLAERGKAVHLRYADNSNSLIDIPVDGYRWVSFFTQAADKGREILLEYNERAAVSRLVVPGLLREAPAFVEAGVEAGVEALPQVAALAKLALDDPELGKGLQDGFPALLEDRGRRMIKVQDRARHHLGEVTRVREAAGILKSQAEDTVKMVELGKLLNQTHASLRDLYDVSLQTVEDLRCCLGAMDGVLGSRIIGGGFGGNVLALVRERSLNRIIEGIDAVYYRKLGRNAANEGAIRVSTPGEGLRWGIDRVKR